jgi:hypothetical protein
MTDDEREQEGAEELVEDLETTAGAFTNVAGGNASPPAPCTTHAKSSLGTAPTEDSQVSRRAL